MNAKTAGLYIHIPFCLSKCPYCDFYSVSSLSMLPAFLETLFQEMELYRGRIGPCDTVYIGGGTPSLLNPSQLEAILKRVRENFRLLPNAEITLETNPADLDQAALASIRAMGINRLTIGCQSFDQAILTFLGRRHSADQAVNAIEAARSAGFANIGLDLIYGIPGQEMEAWMDTVRRALSFAPAHLSCYQLTVEPETLLGISFRQGAFSLPDEILQYDFFIKTAEMLEDAGYVHYEVSNFARDMTLASRHNQKYWDHTPYLGLGPSAHSFAANQRWWNYQSVDRYITALKSGHLPVEASEGLTMEQLQLEALYLGLRTKRGIHLKGYAARYCLDLLARKGDRLTTLQDEGLIAIEDGHLYPTRAGLAVADSLALI
ncbi:MAG: radical SAM family heme chaperone HemW [Deltaproteobacteria bacterium]|nr:radical SAM family heme chaperone HemW [Deltaproteobacteria bacterium]